MRNGNLDRLANPVTFRNERDRTSAPNRIAPEAGKALAVGEAESTHRGGHSRSLRQSIAEAERGELIDLDEALRELDAT